MPNDKNSSTQSSKETRQKLKTCLNNTLNIRTWSFHAFWQNAYLYTQSNGLGFEGELFAQTIALLQFTSVWNILFLVQSGA